MSTFHYFVRPIVLALGINMAFLLRDHGQIIGGNVLLFTAITFYVDFAVREK